MAIGRTADGWYDAMLRRQQSQADVPMARTADRASSAARRRSTADNSLPLEGALMKRTLAIVLVAAAVGGLGGAVVGLALDGRTASASVAETASAASASHASMSTGGNGLTPAQIYRRDAPGVVVITDTQTQVVAPTPFAPGGKQQVRALGSGFVIDKRGDIVTNEHVVHGASHIRVGFTGGASYSATIVGSDPSTDIAVVRVKAPASALRPLAFGPSTTLAVGDPAYAIGNPFGLERTMTAGIVSATGREIQAPNGLTIANAIQIDAPINHGNSGGPLLDRYGRVIGINAQLPSGTVDANVGVGFAIPSDTASAVTDQLIEKGRAEHAWLGIEVAPIEPSVACVVKGLPSHGVVVARVVKGSPAAKAGLVAAKRHVTVNGVSALLGGDAIVAIDGKRVYSAAQLATKVALSKPGDTLELEVVRGGATRRVGITLGDVPH
jgi:putative serine protease PepD